MPYSNRCCRAASTALVVSVVVWEMQVGMAAMTGAALLSLLSAGDEREAIKRMPWGVVLMVCGVTVLIGVLEKTQGMALFTDLLAKLSTLGRELDAFLVETTLSLAEDAASAGYRV